MKLIATDYGTFSEIDHLNDRFKNGTDRLKITVDTVSPRSLYLERFPQLLFEILEIFPNLKKHRCSHGQIDSRYREYDTSHLVSPIKLVGDVIDTVHLFEHVILEMQCQIGTMEACSGLTCNYWEPENRYDIFIEADEPLLASFSCNASLDLVEKLLYGAKGEHDIHDTILLAKKLYGEKIGSIKKIGRELTWTQEKVEESLGRLEAFNFPFSQYRSAA